jgi:hypothetical protein
MTRWMNKLLSKALFFKFTKKYPKLMVKLISHSSLLNTCELEMRSTNNYKENIWRLIIKKTFSIRLMSCKSVSTITKF